MESKSPFRSQKYPPVFSPGYLSRPILGELNFDHTKNPQILLTLLNQGCPPTTLGTIYPAPSSDYLHALKLGIDKPAAFLEDKNVTSLPKWHLNQIVAASLAQEGTKPGSKAEDELYKTEYHRRSQALRTVQSKVVAEYDRLGELLMEWEFQNDGPWPPIDYTLCHIDPYVTLYGPERMVEVRKLCLVAEVERIKAERRESLSTLGLAWLLDLSENGGVARPEQRNRYYRGRKGFPIQKCGAVAFEPEGDSIFRDESAAEALVELSRSGDRSRIISTAKALIKLFKSGDQPQITGSADSVSVLNNDESGNDSIRTISEGDLTEDEIIIVTSSCKRKRSLHTPGLITTDDEELPVKRQRKSLSAESHLEEEYPPSAVESDISGSVYSDNSHSSNEYGGVEVVPPVLTKRQTEYRIATTKRLSDKSAIVPAPPPPPPSLSNQHPIAILPIATPSTDGSSKKAAVSPNPRRPRSVSPLFHATKTLSESAIQTLESDYPFLPSITPSSLRHDYYHFLSCFGNPLMPSTPSISALAPSLTNTNPHSPPIPGLTQQQPQAQRKSLKTELNAWFAANGKVGLKRADAFLKCLWDACGEIVPIEGTDKTNSEKRYKWKH